MAEYAYPLLAELAQRLMLTDPLYSGGRVSALDRGLLLLARRLRARQRRPPAPPAALYSLPQPRKARPRLRPPLPGCRLLSREENLGATPIAGCQAGDPIGDLQANPTGRARFFFAFSSVVECQPPQSTLPYEARARGRGREAAAQRCGQRMRVHASNACMRADAGLQHRRLSSPVGCRRSTCCSRSQLITRQTWRESSATSSRCVGPLPGARRDAGGLGRRR